MTAIAEEITQTTQPATAAAISGVVDLGDGRGFLRTAGYRRSAADIPISPAQVRQYGLRSGDHIEGTTGTRPGKAQPDKTPQGEAQSNRTQQNKARQGTQREGKTLFTVESVNGLPVAEARQRPDFDSLTPVYPNQRFRLEDGDPSRTARIIDLVSPIGKGQRGLIVAPPKAGKTTVLKTIAHAIATAYPEVHLMLAQVGERPEEVTDLRRTVRGEVVASAFDQSPADHIKAAELAIERAKRLAELGRDVVVMLDSLTRLGRAYNLAAPASSRTLTGGVAVSALQPPRQFLGAARCLEEGGSLTILSTALIDTGSQLDNVLFEEFNGTGNMELRLRRDLAEKRMFPAIDPVPSGTRREDLLMDRSCSLSDGDYRLGGRPRTVLGCLVGRVSPAGRGGLAPPWRLPRGLGGPAVPVCGTCLGCSGGSSPGGDPLVASGQRRSAGRLRSRLPVAAPCGRARVFR